MAGVVRLESFLLRTSNIRGDMNGIAALTFSLLCVAVSGVFALTNLVQNPGFEEGYVRWRASGPGISIASDAHSDSKAIKMVSGTQRHLFLQQDVPVTAGKVYTISAWIKQSTSGPAVGYVHYFYMNGTTAINSSFIEHLEGTFDWKQTKTASLAPDGATVLRLMLYFTIDSGMGGSGTGNFDDITVYENEYISTKTNLLTNPGFENGTTGWSNITANKTASGAVIRSGSSALRLAGTGGWDHFYQEVPAAPGDGFSFSGYTCLRTPSGDSVTQPGSWATWQFDYYDAGGHSIYGHMDLMYPSNYSWTRVQRDMLLAPQGTVKFTAQAWISQTTNIGYFDDAYLAKLTKNPNPPAITFMSAQSAEQKSTCLTYYDALGRKILPHLNDRTNLAVYFAQSQGKWILMRGGAMAGPVFPAMR